MNKPSLIFDIKRYSINDGPGIRVTVFFKGCPLSCKWCHNPESRSSGVQKLYSAGKCIGCGSCVETCPEKALTLVPGTGILTNNELCNLCGICAGVCPTKAMEMSGRQQSVDQIMKVIRRESILMETSGGGVTFSGGEPLQHPDILFKLLKACKSEGIHTAIDTSGFVNADILLEAAKFTDLFLYDLKLIDSSRHKEYTGVPNEKIISNLCLLAETGSQIIIRVPLIEGVNADEENIEATPAFIVSLPGEPKTVNLLLYHSIAARKYKKLGGNYNPENMREPDKIRIANCIRIFEEHGITASVGG
jgi:pyruvate formate lyase activating enzyme